MKYLIVSALLLCLAANASAQIVVDLRNGSIHDLGTTPLPTRASGLTYSNPYVTVTVARLGGCAATPFQALIQANLTPANAAARKRILLDVDYAVPTSAEPNLPSGWVTHIGDDSANDGYGGGSGIDGVAEAHVTNQVFHVYSTALGPGSVQRILSQDMQLAGGSLRFDIANQFLGYGQQYNIIDSERARKLFAFPDSRGDSRIFIGLNRVVSARADRTGCGAARAIVQLEQ